MRCRMTASLRATATLAFLKPMRLASLSPPGLEPAPVMHAGHEHAGGLEEVGPDQAITAFGDPAGPIDFA
jgi:hypothetical protein